MLKQKFRSRQEEVRPDRQNAPTEKGDSAIKKAFATLFASTALIAGIGLPAWSAMHGAVKFEGPRDEALAVFRNSDASLALASDDDGVDLDQGRSQRRGDDGDDHGKSGEADDDDSYGGNARAAPTASVAPPDNGLFDSGAAPKVQTD